MLRSHNNRKMTSVAILLTAAAAVISTSHAAPPPPRVTLGSSNFFFHHPHPLQDTATHIQDHVINLPVNENDGASNTAAHHQNNRLIKDEEETQLEDLKELNHKRGDDVTTNTSAVVAGGSIAAEYAKKPVNEEKPALSDNANSLKFSGAAGSDNVDNIAQFLNFKKSHNNNNEDSAAATELFGGGGPRIRLDLMDNTPQDVAQYIFWTGDQRGVANTIASFLQSGKVDREDAVRFLEEVKTQLTLLKNRFPTPADDNQHQQHQMRRTEGPAVLDSLNSVYDDQQEYDSPLSSPTDLMMSARQQQQQPFIREEESQQTTQQIMREALLEQLIYQLAKEYFGDKLHPQQQSDDPSAILMRFSSFIDNQAAKGLFPVDLQKHVLDALLQALLDSADETDENIAITAPASSSSSGAAAAAAAAAGIKGQHQAQQQQQQRQGKPLLRLHENIIADAASAAAGVKKH